MTATTSADPTAERRAHPLAGEVLDLVGKVAAAARDDDKATAAAALEADAARVRRGTAAVVVVGEKKRGKSSLINALVDRPGLLPVDADVATCVHIVVSHGTEGAEVLSGGATTGRAIDLDELAEYAALDPDGREPRHDDVSQVRVRLPAPLLAGGLELIDTPGVGGLVAGHAALTMATLDRADALMFVLDGSGEITASELAFLERATERIATVVFALTKIDLFPEWEAVHARNIALIAEHAPRYADAPWFGVSSRLAARAAQARAAGRTEAAEQRHAESRMQPLEAHLTDLAEGADGLRLANVVHQATELTKRLSQIQVRRALSLTLDPEFGASIKREEAALTALQAQNAVWRQTLNERPARLEQRLRTELARRLEDLRKDVGDRIAAAKGDVFDDVVGDLPPRAQALWIEMDTLLRRRARGARRGGRRRPRGRRGRPRRRRPRGSRAARPAPGGLAGSGGHQPRRAGRHGGEPRHRSRARRRVRPRRNAARDPARLGRRCGRGRLLLLAAVVEGAGRAQARGRPALPGGRRHPPQQRDPAGHRPGRGRRP